MNIFCLSVFICLVVVLVSVKFHYFDNIALQALHARYTHTHTHADKGFERKWIKWKIIAEKWLTINFYFLYIVSNSWLSEVIGYWRNGKCKQNCAKWKNGNKMQDVKRKWEKRKTNRILTFVLLSIWYFIFCILFIFSLM